MTLNKQWILFNCQLDQRRLRQVENKELLLSQEDNAVEEDKVAEDVVVVVVTIAKVNGHTRVDAEDTEHVGDVVVQINVCNLTTMEIYTKELIGWRISYMNQVLCQVYGRAEDPIT